jgi:hypothetical protein
MLEKTNSVTVCIYDYFCLGLQLISLIILFSNDWNNPLFPIICIPICCGKFLENILLEDREEDEMPMSWKIILINVPNDPLILVSVCPPFVDTGKSENFEIFLPKDKWRF